MRNFFKSSQPVSQPPRIVCPALEVDEDDKAEVVQVETAPVDVEPAVGIRKNALPNEPIVGWKW